MAAIMGAGEVTCSYDGKQRRAAPASLKAMLGQRCDPDHVEHLIALVGDPQAPRLAGELIVADDLFNNSFGFSHSRRKIRELDPASIEIRATLYDVEEVSGHDNSTFYRGVRSLSGAPSVKYLAALHPA